MRDLNRRRVAAARSRRARPEDLREARQRLKEIDSELRQIELAPETKHGEERELRYARVLRLRALRDEFQSSFPVEESSRPNSLLLALVMTICSFALCAFCAVAGLAGLSLLNQKPDPSVTASAFWTGMEQASYDTIYSSLLSPTLRTQDSLTIFVNLSQQADQQFGRVSDATLSGTQTISATDVVMTYSVTRGNGIHYTVKLSLTQHFNTWGVSDLGAAITPTTAGLHAPKVTPTATATATAQPSPSP